MVKGLGIGKALTETPVCRGQKINVGTEQPKRQGVTLIFLKWSPLPLTIEIGAPESTCIWEIFWLSEATATAIYLTRFTMSEVDSTAVEALPVWVFEPPSSSLKTIVLRCF